MGRWLSLVWPELLLVACESGRPLPSRLFVWRKVLSCLAGAFRVSMWLICLRHDGYAIGAHHDVTLNDLVAWNVVHIRSPSCADEKVPLAVGLDAVGVWNISSLK